jgi:PPP family 3-phenylpropionic acid transporter
MPKGAVGVRQLAPFALFSACYFAHAGFFVSYLPLWLKSQGMGLVTISMLTSTQAATRLFAPYGWGALSDHTGQRVLLLRYCAVAALVASFGLAMDWGLAGLAAVLLLLYTHTSAMTPMSEAALAELVSRDGGFDARRYGRVRLWGSIGFMLSVLVFGMWFDHFGMQSFPVLTCATLVLLVASSAWMPNTREAAHAQEPRPPIGPILRQQPVRWLFICCCFQVLSHTGINVFFSLYLDALGYSKTTIGLLWAVSVTAEVGWFYSQNRWLPRFSLPGWLVISAATMALRMLLTASSANVLWVLVLAQTLHAITFAAHHGVCISLLSHHFPGRLRGRGQALYTVLGYGCPGVLGAWAGGYLSAKYGLAQVYWASLAMSLIALGCAVRVWRLSTTGRNPG